MPRRRGATEQIEFATGEPGEVIAEMVAIGVAGRGWLNVVPVVGDEVDIPPTPGPLAVFHSRGPAVPFGTWTPGAEGGGEPESLGIQHGAGPKALERLAGAGLVLPARWTSLADHPRRGLVVRVAAPSGPDAVLDWLLAAMVGLAQVPLTGRWMAGVYRR